MKKSIFMAAAALLMLGLGACSEQKCHKGADSCKCDKDVVYTGVLPAADADGMRCTLKLDYEDDGQEGDYKMVETYIHADSTSATGYKDGKSFKSKGDFTVTKTGDKTCFKMVKKGDPSDVMYFVADTDSTITMTDDKYEMPQTEGMNYTLKEVK